MKHADMVSRAQGAAARFEPSLIPIFGHRDPREYARHDLTCELRARGEYNVNRASTIQMIENALDDAGLL